MIDITIKTLDSRNHFFSVEDELTVKQLKERIAEPVNVPAESQRLIYCGRVLVDEKKLSEYDVHGKVIHLVQRAPPSTSQDTSSTSSEPRPSTTTRRGPFFSMPRRVDGAGGNAMYLGAMAFPADLMDAQGISMPQPRHRLSQSRLTVARGMLRRARYTLLNLENPTHSDLPQEGSSNTEDIQQDLNAQAAELVDEIAASTSNVGVQHPPPHINIEASGGEGDMQSDEADPASDRNSPEDVGSPSGEDSGPQLPNGDASENIRNGRYRFPGPVNMAEIIFFVRDVERRLSPFLERFYELVRTDPVLENPAEAQRLFDLVSKMMHYLAHAYHAISDIMCDFSQPPPRRLRCRPVLIQHSAVLQTGIPIQAQLNVGGNANVSFSSSSSNGMNNNNQTTTANSNSEGAAAAEARSSEEAAPEEVTPPSQPSQPPPASSESNNGRTGNLSGGNFEVYMDVGQGSITIDSVEATLVTNSGQGGSETPGTSITSGPFPWGSPPPEFLQNLMQALAGHMMGGTSTSTSSTSGSSNSGATASTSGSSAPGGATAPPHAPEAANVTNSQARGNTSTQPTTSTQTRSTTRPHVHIAPGFQGRESRGIGPGFFDPFLPCNSHHIHGSRRRIAEESSVNNNNGNSTSQSSQSTGTSTESPPRPSTSDAPSFANLFSNLFSGMRAGANQGQGSPSLIRILPRDVTVFLQGSPPLQNMNLHRETTVLELLQSLPDYSYTEGSSIFSDFAMMLARNLRVLDVLNMGSTNSSLLITLRPVLREFIINRLLLGREPSEQAMTDAVNRINTELRPLIESILSQEEIPLRDDVDIIATINQLNHISIPTLIRDIIEGDDAQFLQNVPNRCNEYASHLASILYHCCHNGQQGLEAIYTIIARRIIVGVPSALQNWSVVHIVNQLRAMANVLETSRETVQRLLVYRMADARMTDAPVDDNAEQPQAMETEAVELTAQQPYVSAASSTPLRVMSPIIFNPDMQQAEVAPPEPVPPPPEYEMSSPRIRASISPPRIISPRDISSPEIERDMTWQNSVPPDWVPIISRDRERQRRQAVQGPFSDAYLSGMPSKRRKMITSAKPHSNLSRVITESMSSALGAAGVDRVEPGLADAAGSDSSLRQAYKEQVKNTLSPTVRQHPDFTPEKYPAAAKLFTPK